MREHTHSVEPEDTMIDLGAASQLTQGIPFKTEFEVLHGVDWREKPTD